MILSIPMSSLSFPVVPLVLRSLKQGPSGPHVDFSREPNISKLVRDAPGKLIFTEHHLQCSSLASQRLREEIDSYSP